LLALKLDIFKQICTTEKQFLNPKQNVSSKHHLLYFTDAAKFIFSNKQQNNIYFAQKSSLTLIQITRWEKATHQMQLRLWT